MKLVLILVFFVSFGLVYSQEKDMDYCKANFYRGGIIQNYSVYDINSETNSLFSISKKEVMSLKSEFNSDEIVKSINEIKSNSIFVNLISKYAGTSEYDSQTLYTFSEQYKNQEDYKSYINNYNILDCFIAKILNDYPKILNISLYSNFEDYGDCFFYQKGYNDFSFIMVCSPIIISVLHGFDESEIQNYDHNLFGAELRETGQVITIPLVIENEYICDIRIMVCRN